VRAFRSHRECLAPPRARGQTHVVGEAEEKPPHGRLSWPIARTIHKLLQVDDLVGRHDDPMPDERERESKRGLQFLRQQGGLPRIEAALGVGDPQTPPSPSSAGRHRTSSLVPAACIMSATGHLANERAWGTSECRGERARKRQPPTERAVRTCSGRAARVPPLWRLSLSQGPARRRQLRH
jgi:hypothetical protein